MSEITAEERLRLRIEAEICERLQVLCSQTHRACPNGGNHLSEAEIVADALLPWIVEREQAAVALARTQALKDANKEVRRVLYQEIPLYGGTDQFGGEAWSAGVTRGLVWTALERAVAVLATQNRECDYGNCTQAPTHRVKVMVDGRRVEMESCREHVDPLTEGLVVVDVVATPIKEDGQ